METVEVIGMQSHNCRNRKGRRLVEDLVTLYNAHTERLLQRLSPP